MPRATPARVRVSELDYELPEELIAQAPSPERDGARLLVLDRDDGSVTHGRVRELPDLLRPALWVVNDTRVIPARLFATKPSGGRVEILLLERRSPGGCRERWRAMGRASKPLRVGTVLQIEGAQVAITIGERFGDGTLEVELEAPEPIDAVLERVGHVPLPPYIRRPDAVEDRSRYQTVFAAKAGAVAAPTAGLHFSERLLAELASRGHRLARVTLHVGAGTFRPVTAEKLEDHDMHTERYEVTEEAAVAIARARRDAMPVVAVGTTVVRTLESAATGDGLVRAGVGETGLMIQPPYAFQVVDVLFTNFHLPRSTLIALVMAFGGIERVRQAYGQAVAERYRFFSYGDAMLVRSPGARAKSRREGKGA
jgi:S-adenosylmethionine:tRNA ribosyltransferase-isomerase